MCCMFSDYFFSTFATGENKPKSLVWKFSLMAMSFARLYSHCVLTVSPGDLTIGGVLLPLVSIVWKDGQMNWPELRSERLDCVVEQGSEMTVLSPAQRNERIALHRVRGFRFVMLPWVTYVRRFFLRLVLHFTDGLLISRVTWPDCHAASNHAHTHLPGTAAMDPSSFLSSTAAGYQVETAIIVNNASDESDTNPDVIPANNQFLASSVSAQDMPSAVDASVLERCDNPLLRCLFLRPWLTDLVGCALREKMRSPIFAGSVHVDVAVRRNGYITTAFSDGLTRSKKELWHYLWPVPNAERTTFWSSEM